MLTKSRFKNFLQCRNEFWLDHHFPEPAEEESVVYRHLREAGYEVEMLARTLPIFQSDAAGPVTFGKEFSADGMYARTDAVVTHPSSGAIDIYEVKSGTKVKDDYLTDLTFQCMVAEKAGYTVGRGYLITVDTNYVLDGELHTESLLRVSDQTEYVTANKAAVAVQSAEALAALQSDETVPSLVDYCKGNKLDCRSVRRHHPNIPDYNVSHLFNAGTKKLNALLDAAILNFSDIPGDFALTERERAIVELERTQVPYIDRDTILAELGACAYPLNFLDYESFNPAVPKFQLTRPFQQMVFQYSLHTIDEPGGEVRHSYHLSRNDGRHPTEEIVERLNEDLNGRIGTVIIWSEGFEKGRNTEMGGMYADHAAFLNDLNDRVYDLRKIFSNRLFMHPACRGRDSLKRILPVLCPHLPSYNDMPIGDGMTASVKWYHAATGRCTAAEREEIFRDLEAYCHLDTLAMVEIYKYLLAI